MESFEVKPNSSKNSQKSIASSIFSHPGVKLLLTYTLFNHLCSENLKPNVTWNPMWNLTSKNAAHNWLIFYACAIDIRLFNRNKRPVGLFNEVHYQCDNNIINNYYRSVNSRNPSIRWCMWFNQWNNLIDLRYPWDNSIDHLFLSIIRSIGYFLPGKRAIQYWYHIDVHAQYWYHIDVLPQ